MFPLFSLEIENGQAVRGSFGAELQVKPHFFRRWKKNA
jgi:hypothetical protein